jgi:hypothetical protein
MLFQAAYLVEPAEIPGERIHAGLSGLSGGRKHVGELSDAQMQGGGQPFSVEPELQMCRSVALMGCEPFPPFTPIDSVPVAPVGSKG